MQSDTVAMEPIPKHKYGQIRAYSQANLGLAMVQEGPECALEVLYQILYCPTVNPGFHAIEQQICGVCGIKYMSV